MFLILILITIQNAVGRQLPENHIQTSKQLKHLISDDNSLSYNQNHIRVGDDISKSMNTLEYDEGATELIDPDTAVIPIKKVKTNAKKSIKKPKKSRKNWKINSNKVETFMNPKKIKKPNKTKKAQKPNNQNKQELVEILNSIKNIFSKMHNDEEDIVMKPDDGENEQEISFEETNAENSEAINDEAIKSEEISTENSNQMTNEEVNSEHSQATITEDVNSDINEAINIQEINAENSEVPTIEEFNAENDKEIRIKIEPYNIPDAISTTESMVKIEEMTQEVTTDLEPYQIDVPTNTVDKETQIQNKFNEEPASVVESTTKVDDNLSLKTELKTIAQILLEMKPLDYGKIVQIYYEFLLIYKNMMESINSLSYALTNIDKNMSEQNALMSTRKCNEIDQTLPLIPTKIRANWKDKCFNVLPANREDFTRIKKEFINYNRVKKAYEVNKENLIKHIKQTFFDVLMKLQSINSFTSMYSENDMFVIGYIASKADHLEGELLNKKAKMINDLTTCSNKELFEVFDLLQNSEFKLTNIEELLTKALLRSQLPPFEQTLITGQ